MEKERTVGQYRGIDLMLFALMLAAAETLIVKAAGSWFPDQLYTFSAVAAVTAIVMMRWGPWAAIHAVLGGAAFCWAGGASPTQYAVYCGGNLLGLGALALRKWLGPEKIRQDALKSMAFGIATAVLMQLGRALVALIFGAAAGDAIRFVATDVLTVLFTAVVMWIVRRLDGIFEDQIHYLLRLNREREEEKENFQ